VLGFTPYILNPFQTKYVMRKTGLRPKRLKKVKSSPVPEYEAMKAYSSAGKAHFQLHALAI
jgi:hypothetical protein